MRVLNSPSSDEWVQLKRSFFAPAIFVAIIWLVKFAEFVFQTSFHTWGVLPGEWSGLVGIFTSPFIHGSLEHLASNSIPMLVLFTGAIYFYRGIAFTVFFWIMLMSGLGVWLFGNYSDINNPYHIGASGVIYGLVTFLFFSGVLRKSKRLLAISMLVLFFYGGLVWGILPHRPNVSWEGHLFGAVAGILCAIWFREEGPQRDHVYDWEDEEEDDDFDDDEFLYRLGKPQGDPPKPSNGTAKIRYLYRPNPNRDRDQQS